MINRNDQVAIHCLMNAFEKGSMDLFNYVDSELDLAIDHFRDSVDTKWQTSKNLEELGNLLGRLKAEVFPKGTHILRLESLDIGDGWHLTFLEQEFWYAIESQDVVGKSVILSHEIDGKLDYFRETVQSVTPVSEIA